MKKTMTMVAGIVGVLVGMALVMPAIAQLRMEGVLPALGVALLMLGLLLTAGGGAMVLVRQPIYAIFLAIAGFALVVIGGEWAFGSYFFDVRRGWIVLSTYSALSLVAAIAIAWVALRKDWGWKR